MGSVNLIILCVLLLILSLWCLARIRPRFINLWLAIWAVFFALTIAETGLTLFYVKTDFWGFTGSAQRWWDAYWHPVNSAGYRDLEWSKDQLQNRELVYVVGDSIVAGHGIDHIEDRFSNRLGFLLGNNYRVLNIAKCGWDFSQELAALKTQIAVAPPKYVVWSFYFNDIEGLIDVAKPPQPIMPTGFLSLAVDRSALVNLAYWTFIRRTLPQVNSDYAQYFKSAQNDLVVWDKQSQLFQQLQHLAIEKQFKLIFIISPNLAEWGSDKDLLDKVSEYWSVQGIDVLDTRKIIGAQSPNQFKVNSLDHHPNVFLHRSIADYLAGMIIPATPIP